MVKPTRNAEYPWMYELTVVLRRQLVEITGPEGFPSCDGVEAGGTFADVTVGNHNQEGNETIEIWLQQLFSVSGGVSTPSAGVLRGVTDFSEFIVDAGLPSGITRFGALSGAGGPSSLAIVDDVDEGHTFVMDGHDGAASWGFGYDAFDGIAGAIHIEMLARMWIGAGGRSQGPLASVTDGPYSFYGEHILQGFEPFLTILGHGSASAVASPMQEASQTGVWAWLRWRRLLDSPGIYSVFAKSWFGDLIDEPVAWDGQVLGSVVNVTPAVDEAIGWGGGGNPGTSGKKIAFLSWTNDPLNFPPLEPDDVLAGLGPWVLVGTVPVSISSSQVVTIEGLDSLSEYNVAFRYRRDGLFNPGASGSDPSIWPSISRCNFTTTIDPPEVSEATWSRTSAIAERVTLTIVPNDTDADINVYRRTALGDPVLIDTIAGPHVGDVTYVDETISGETGYWYSATTDSTIESPPSDEVRVWAGPAAIPVYVYQITAHSGYTIGFTTVDPTVETELHDSYDDAGGNGALQLRATAAAGETEVFSGFLPGVPEGTFQIEANLRHKLTSFTVDDFGEFGVQVSVFLPEEE
jgi:hypothetical protein